MEKPPIEAKSAAPRPKKIIVILLGSCITVAGLILMPIPGPGGTPVFLAGLALLATELDWAKRFLVRFKDSYARMEKWKRRLLTTALLIFYVASGVLVWYWMDQKQADKRAATTTAAAPPS